MQNHRQVAEHARGVLGSVKCYPYTFKTGFDDGKAYLQVVENAGYDWKERFHAVQKGRKWLLSEHMGKGEIIQTAFMAVMAFEEHELRERFTVDGVSVFDPHYDIDKLVQHRRKVGSLQLRPSVETTHDQS